MQCPDWIDPYAQQLWPEVVADLERRGRRLIVHHQQVVMFCQCVAQYRDATLNLIKNGQIAEEQHVTAHVDQVKQKVHPAFQIQSELIRQAERLIKEMGLNEPLEEETSTAATGLSAWLERAIRSHPKGARKRPAGSSPKTSKRSRRAADLN